MRARHIGLGLSLFMAFAWGRADAQQPQVQIIYVEQVPIQTSPVQGVPVQTIDGVPVQGLPIQGVPIDSMPIEALPAAQPVRGIRVASWPLFGGADGSTREAMNRRGYCCDSHIDAYGCQNWRTQCQFVFGSCRSFFGEPCRPAPPLFQNHRGRLGFGGDCNR